MDGDIEIALVGTGMITIHPDGLGSCLSVDGRLFSRSVRGNKVSQSGV